ncbi:MAG TPA: chemotaxis protein [Burkholderiales bacterium]
MAGSTLNPENFPATNPRKGPKGHDTRSLGPSDSSDSGSDMAGDSKPGKDTEGGREDNSDRHGTGERLAADEDPGMRVDGDHDTDRIVGEEEAGLGGGLDQAEEAQLGITDEELERTAKPQPQWPGKSRK